MAKTPKKASKGERSDELSAYLDALRINERLEVEELLKSSPAETTELVADEEGHLYVRKTIARGSGTGSVYARIKAAQDAGRSLPHLPRVSLFLKTESQIIVVMEYLRGENLWDRLEREGCGVASARKYFPALCRAVSELHEGFDPPIIHRDLKPTNVLITPYGHLKLLDFGISREYRSDAPTDTQFLGTREYAPPEQFGYRQTDERSDVYSLGMILYHMLTGQTPSASLHDGGFIDPDIPEALREVLMTATEFDPNHRFQNATALRLAFEQALGNVPGGLPHAPASAPAAGFAVPAPAPAAAAEQDDAFPPDTPAEAMIRDVLALILVAISIGLIIFTWPVLEPGAGLGYNTGLVLSGFVLFLPLV
ncbi:MAG: serine/threonine protein kinase, partial [Eggerthellaceae bacterium]|nr:serine/threonine protein kinase [Eggerthellaceae bacterium]